MIEYTDYTGPQKGCVIIDGAAVAIDQVALKALALNAMALAGALKPAVGVITPPSAQLASA